MAYVHKIIGKEETLVGIARLHWIYVVKGLAYFMAFTAFGMFLDALVLRAVGFLARHSDSLSFFAVFADMSNSLLMILMGVGFLIFMFFVLKVLSTEIALTTRRVIDKRGLIFVKVKEIDVEEIRGENLDLGYLGRILGYGYLNLDCRFIGDVTLPAIEEPERFLKALHMVRSKAQDSLAVVMGKGNGRPLEVVPPPSEEENDQTLQPAPPAPSIDTDTPPTAEEVEAAVEQEKKSSAPFRVPQPSTPKADPQQQHYKGIPKQGSPEDVALQQQVALQQYAMMVQAGLQPPLPPMPNQPEGAAPPADAPVSPAPAAQQAAPVQVDPQTVTQIMEQVMPQMVEKMTEEMVAKGLVAQPKPETTPAEIDTNLLASFDEASMEGVRHEGPDKNKLEHVVH